MCQFSEKLPYSLKAIDRLLMYCCINNHLKPFTGKMENVLNEDSVSDQTQILLVNAAYFVTNWMKKFPEAEIKECPFKVNKVCSGKKKKIPFPLMKMQTLS